MDILLKPYRIGILLLLISLGSISAVVLTPALPELSHVFGISGSEAQLTMSVYLVGYAIGQLPYGPIANRYGRKKAILIGVWLLLAGSVLAISSSDFWVLLLGRFIQALGAAAGLQITMTMISDRHEGPKATRAISLLGLAFALMTPIGVTVGGYLTTLWGWRGCFVFMILYAIILGFLSLLLPETANGLNPKALQLKKIAEGYLHQFKSRTTVINALSTGLVSSTYYSFATLSPFIGINRIGLTPDHFGLWNQVLCLGLLLGIGFTQATAKLGKSRLIILVGILIMALGVSTMTFCFALSLISVWTLFIPATIMRIGANAIWSHASSNGLTVSHDKSNTSAVMQFINLGVSTTAVFLASAIPSSHVMLLPVTLGTIVLLLFIVWKMN